MTLVAYDLIEGVLVE